MDKRRQIGRYTHTFPITISVNQERTHSQPWLAVGKHLVKQCYKQRTVEERASAINPVTTENKDDSRLQTYSREGVSLFSGLDYWTDIFLVFTHSEVGFIESC